MAHLQKETKLDSAVLENPGRSLLAEAERLHAPETLRSALLIAWAAIEAFARRLIERKTSQENHVSPLDLINQLVEADHISTTTAEKLQSVLEIRNRVAHGIAIEEISDKTVRELLKVARQLYLQDQGEHQPQGRQVTKVVRIHPRLRDSRFNPRVERATQILNEIMKGNHHIVYLEWDLARDKIGHDVALLSLWDYSGQVRATFTFEELGNEENLTFRLKFVWGDLLRLRLDQLSEGMTQE